MGHTNQILQARDKYEAIHVLVSDQQMIARIALTWPSSSRPSARVTYWPNGKILTEMAPPPQPWQLEDRSETDLACSISRQFRSQYVLHCHNLLQIFHSNVQGGFFNWPPLEFAKCWPVSNRFRKNVRVPDRPPPMIVKNLSVWGPQCDLHTYKI